MDRTIPLIVGVAVGVVLAILLLWPSPEPDDVEVSPVVRVQANVTFVSARGTFRGAFPPLAEEICAVGQRVPIPVFATDSPALFGTVFEHAVGLAVTGSKLPPLVNVEHASGVMGAPLVNETRTCHGSKAIVPAVMIEHSSGLWWTGLESPGR